MKMTMANENIIQIKFAFFPLIQVFSEELWSREQNQSGGKVLVRGGATQGIFRLDHVVR